MTAYTINDDIRSYHLNSNESRQDCRKNITLHHAIGFIHVNLKKRGWIGVVGLDRISTDVYFEQSLRSPLPLLLPHSRYLPQNFQPTFTILPITVSLKNGKFIVTIKFRDINNKCLPQVARAWFSSVSCHIFIAFFIMFKRESSRVHTKTFPEYRKYKNSLLQLVVAQMQVNRKAAVKQSLTENYPPRPETEQTEKPERPLNEKIFLLLFFK